MDRPQIASIFSFLNSGSKQDQDRIKYRTYLLPKHAAKVVTQIEKLTMLRETLDDGQKGIATYLLDVFDKALIATTSIKGHQTAMLTTNKSVVQINDPRLKKSTFGNLMNPQRQDGLVEQ